MKIFILLFGLLLVSCKQGPLIIFDKPQPENSRDLGALPFRYRGVYKDPDSVFLSIDKINIIRKYSFLTHILRSQLDSFPEIKYSERKIQYLTRDESYIAMQSGDTIFWTENVSDTLFSISDKNKARRLRGYLVLNTRLDSAQWKVDLMNLKSGLLKFIDIGSKEDLAKLSEIVMPEAQLDSAKHDTLRYILRPNRKEFRALLKIKGFKGQKEYKKIR